MNLNRNTVFKWQAVLEQGRACTMNCSSRRLARCASPKGATHWTTRTIVVSAGSTSGIVRSTDPFFMSASKPAGSNVHYAVGAKEYARLHSTWHDDPVCSLGRGDGERAHSMQTPPSAPRVSGLSAHIDGAGCASDRGQLRDDKHAKVKAWLEATPILFTTRRPASWLNQVERWFGIIKRAIRVGRFLRSSNCQQNQPIR